MAATRPQLEALLARVRERAAEPRERASGAARQQAAAAAITEAPVARAVAAGDEEIEEYDEELIEIIDDNDVESEAESERPALPLELSASAPSIELRRPAPQPAMRPSEPGPVTARPASAPAARASAPAMMSSRPPAAAVRTAEPGPAGLQAESVGRRPLDAGNVVHAHGARPALGEQRFIDLLDASLGLGN